MKKREISDYIAQIWGILSAIDAFTTAASGNLENDVGRVALNFGVSASIYAVPRIIDKLKGDDSNNEPPSNDGLS